MKKSTSNQVVWITGSGSGVGKHLTRMFLNKGYSVIATDINYQAIEKAAFEEKWPIERLIIAKLDVTQPDQWKQVFHKIMDTCQRLDILLNIAGYLKPGYIHQTNSTDVDHHIDINVKGVIYGSQIVAEYFVKEGHGHIINMASLAGIAPIPGIALYSASKFAVRGFSLALAQELRPWGIAVTVLCPDAIQTPMLELQEDYEEAAMTFSGSRALSVVEIEKVLFTRILKKKPLEVTLPAGRGALAKLGNLFPGTTLLFGDALKRKGIKAQLKAKLKRKKSL